jgi:hypothetical protein
VAFLLVRAHLLEGGGRDSVRDGGVLTLIVDKSSFFEQWPCEVRIAGCAGSGRATGAEH